jgi:multidrug efflux pump subunit AcrB
VITYASVVIRAPLLAALALAACGGDAPARPSGARVLVVATYAGASAEVVESSVTTPLERALASAPRVARITSRSRAGAATITVEAARPDELDALVDALRARLPEAQRELPVEVPPVTIRRDGPSTYVHRFVATSDDRPLAYAAEVLREAIERTAGVQGLVLCGAPELELVVELDPRRLAAWSLDAKDVVSALTAGNTNLPAGRLDATGHVVRVLGEATTVEEIGELPLPSQPRPARIGDVAVVSLRETPTCRTHHGIVGAIHVVGDPRATLAQIRSRLADARVEVDDLAAPAVLTATIERGAATADDLERRIASVTERLRELPDVAWVTSEQPDEGAAIVRVAVATASRAVTVETNVTGEFARVPLVAAPRIDGGRPTVEAVLVGPDLAELQERARAAVTALAADAALAAVGCDPCLRTDELRITPDRTRLADVGISVAAVAEAVQLAVGGVPAGTVTPNGKRVDVVVRVPEARPDEVAASLQVRAPTGQLIPLSMIASISAGDAVSEILHEDRERAVIVWARGASRGAVEKALRAALPGARLRSPRAQ